MKVARSFWVVMTLLATALCSAFSQDAPPEVTRALLQAKNVYVVTGHVQYYKTKAVFKKELVDVTPFEEPVRKELTDWGRFTIVTDPKRADLIIRAYEKGNPRYVPVASASSMGGVIYGTQFLFLDVVQPSSKSVIWYASKNLGTSWSNNTRSEALVRKLREYTESQENSGPKLNAAPTPVSEKTHN